MAKADPPAPVPRSDQYPASLLTPGVLNRALDAYIPTVPDGKRLRLHLAAEGLDACQAEVEKLVRLVESDFYDFLKSHSGKAKWSPEFNERVFEHVAKRSPWISREAFSGLSGYGNWLCWHEGFDL